MIAILITFIIIAAIFGIIVMTLSLKIDKLERQITNLKDKDVERYGQMNFITSHQRASDNLVKRSLEILTDKNKDEFLKKNLIAELLRDFRY